MTSAHTPAPWQGAHLRQRDGTYTITQRGALVATVHPRHPPYPDSEQDANAHLIAAAPALLAALKWTLCGVACACCVQVRGLIATAEGRS